MAERTWSKRERRPAIEQKPREFWGIRAAEFYAELQGKNVLLTLVDGQQLVGELVGLDRFDVVLCNTSGRRVLLTKHSIRTVEQER